eukprot:gene11212-7784_t
MSQVHLRRITLVYALVLMVINFFLYLYVYHSMLNELQYAFNKEMILRLGYVSAMVEWIPLRKWLNNPGALSSVSESAPFAVAVYNRSALAIPVETMAMTESFPISVYKYSPTLDAVVSVTEGEISTFGTGIYEEFLAVAACFILLIPFELLAALAVGNLLAQHRRWFLARLAVLLGYVGIPIVISILMLLVMSIDHHHSIEYSWKEDVRRSSLLYMSMFKAARSLEASAGAQKLVATLTRVNEGIIEDQSYQVVLAVGEDQAVAPPLYSDAVHKALFTDARNDHTDFDGQTARDIYAAKGLPSIQSLLVVVRTANMSTSLLDAHYLPVLLLGIAATALFSFIVLVLLFPYSALGKAATGQVHEGVEEEGRCHLNDPWAQRLSYFWPYAKLLESTAVIVMTLLVAAMALARISMHYHRVGALQSYYENKVAKMRDMQTVSNLLAECYAGVMRGDSWNTDFIQYSPTPLPRDTQITVVQFYSRLSSLIAADQFFAYSAGSALAGQPRGTWPIMSNTPFLVDYFRNVVPSMPMLVFHHWVLREDNAFIVAVMANDPTFLENGSDAVTAGLVDSAATLGVDGLPEEVLRAVKALPYASVTYVDIIKKYLSDTIKTSSYVEFFASNLGTTSEAVEDSVSTSRDDAIPPDVFIALTYAWTRFDSFIVLFFCVALAMLYQIFDVFYTATFFSGLSLRYLLSSFDADVPPDRHTLQTKDYTSPRSTMAINPHEERRRVWRLCIYYIFFMLMAVLVSGLLYGQSQETITNLHSAVNEAQDSLIPLSERSANGVVIELTLAYWCRAFLSLNRPSILRAIELTNRWNTMKPIAWTGGSAGTDGTRIQSEVLTALYSSTRKLTAQTAWLQLEPHVDAVYRDLTVLLKKLDHYLHFQGYEQCLAPVLYTWESYINQFLLCLLLQDGDTRCTSETTAPLKALSHMCNGKVPSDLSAYLERLAALQRSSMNMLSPYELSDVMGKTTAQTNTEMLRMLQTMTEELASLKKESTTFMPWIILFYMWLVTPVLVAIFKSVRSMHDSMPLQAGLCRLLGSSRALLVSCMGWSGAFYSRSPRLNLRFTLFLFLIIVILLSIRLSLIVASPMHTTLILLRMGKHIAQSPIHSFTRTNITLSSFFFFHIVSSASFPLHSDKLKAFIDLRERKKEKQHKRKEGLPIWLFSRHTEEANNTHPHRLPTYFAFLDRFFSALFQEE